MTPIEALNLVINYVDIDSELQAGLYKALEIVSEAEQISLAKNILKNAGYATSSLWTTTDVVWALDEMLEEGEITKEEYSKLSESALEIINNTIDGDGITMNINEELRCVWIPEFLEKLRASQEQTED